MTAVAVSMVGPRGTREDLIAFMEDLFKEALELIKAKNSDYATHSDPLSNFRLVEDLGVVSTEKAIYVRLSDKYARLGNFLKKGDLAVKDEKVEDTIKDLINYAGILLYSIKTRETTPKGGGAEEARPQNDNNTHTGRSVVSSTGGVTADHLINIAVGE